MFVGYGILFLVAARDCVRHTKENNSVTLVIEYWSLKTEQRVRTAIHYFHPVRMMNKKRNINEQSNTLTIFRAILASKNVP